MDEKKLESQYSELYYTSKMELFAKTFYVRKPLTIFEKQSILDICQGFESESGMESSAYAMS